MGLTKALFVLSDACSWLLVGLSALFAIVYALVGTTVAEHDGGPVPSTLRIAATSLAWILAAVGAWRLTQRKPWGLVAVCLPALLGSTGFALFHLLLVLSIFGTPLLLALIESRRSFSDDDRR